MKPLLKYPLFILSFIVMLKGYFALNIPTDTPYPEMIDRVFRGQVLVFVGGVASLYFLFRISR